MKTSKNFARVAVTAGLTAAMALGDVVAPAAMAFADTGSTVTFEDADYAASTTYKGIQIFKATVATAADGTKTVSNIAWASPDVEHAVVAAIQATDPEYASNLAQDAADWLNANAGVSGTNSEVASGNVLSKIAANLNGKGAWKTTSAGGASLSGLEAGYWLFLTAAAGTPDGKSTDAFTSPVYAVIDGATSTTVTPKKGVPTVEKKILDDADAAGVADIKGSDKWKDVADSQIGQEVNYRLTGTIASNYATFSTYAYKFTDELSSGLDYVGGSVEVYALNGSTYTKIGTEHYSAVVNDGNTLTVEFKVGDGDKGLKDVEGVGANTQIVVFYKAKLNGKAVIGNAAEGNKGGNPNTVKLEYSNNPYAEGTGQTIEHTVADFAFKLNLNKVDQGTEKGLAGAVFTIQSAAANTKDQYVASKDAVGVVAGQLVTVDDANNLPDYVKFTSGSDGKIAVSGLDAGSYKVTELQTPDDTKYTKANPFTFTIAAEYDNSTMKVTNLTAAVSEADKGRSDIAFGTLDGSAGDNKLTGTDGTGTNAAAGEVTINVGNTKSVGLPITGLDGVTLTWVAGGAVLVIGVAHLIRSRREESEE